MNDNKTHLVRNLLVTGCIAAGLITAGYFYVKHQEQFPSTDDARERSRTFIEQFQFHLT
jgi:membrane fusion protein (multidrug efflux system)